MSHCLICTTAIDPFMSFGPMPIANGFLRSDQFAREEFFDLSVGLCEVCGMVQLTELVDREKMFHGDYAYFSSVSTGMVRHFEQLASQVSERYLTASDAFVVEIGSNDGILLQHFARAKRRHLGIEPSANVAAAARAKGLNTECCFFDKGVAQRIVGEYGQAAVVLAANVMCHLPYFHSVLDGIAAVLKPDGVLVMEDPYLGDILEKTSFDQIYDEHALYFSVSSLGRAVAMHGLEIIDVEPQKTHGGSMRYVIGHQNHRPISAAVAAQRAREAELAVADPRAMLKFRKSVERIRTDLVAMLEDVRRAAKRVVGYGATSKSTTVTNYCKIGPDVVEFISDTTPGKQGRFSPGVHIPVLPPTAFEGRYPDYALLFAWNHAEEIVGREQAFLDAGGRFITYVPNVQILNARVTAT